VIILDTHIWHWWANRIPNKLTREIIAIIEQADEVAVSTISCFEMAWLVRHGRIDLGISIEEWFGEFEASDAVIFLPLTAAIARQAVALPEHHKDPQDRIIIATSLVHDAHLISLDVAFPRYQELQGRLIPAIRPPAP